MLKTGNANPKTCAENLLQIIRGEIPFDRVRGMDARLIDAPADIAVSEFDADARWNIETYEPRISAEGFTIKAEQTESGDFAVNLEISDT